MLHSDLYEGSTLGRLIISSLNRYSDRAAFIYGKKTYSYEETRDSVSLACEGLKELRVCKGDAIVQLSKNHPRQWFVMAAAYLKGFRSVTLHALSSVDDHVYVINNCEAKVAIFGPEFVELIPQLKERCPSVEYWAAHEDSSVTDNFWETCSQRTAGPLTDETIPSDIIRLAYTGGTTGLPKGVELSSQALLYQAMLSLIEKDWPECPSIVCPAPISHGAGGAIIPVLARGGTIILLNRFTADAVIDVIEDLRASVLHLVPTMLYALLDHPRTLKADFSSLATIMYGASPISPDRLQEAIDRFGYILSQGYGQTEAPSSITVLRKSDHKSSDPKRLSSCGRAYPGIQVEVLDEKCSKVPDGNIGEICVRGPILMSGYWRLPEQTAEAFRGGWLHTGDMGYRDNKGFFYIVDRKKDMIISGGFNIYPKEIEDVISAHPAVSAAVIIGVPDRKWGEAVKAFVVVRDGFELTEEALIAFVKDRKGSLHTPKTVKFIDSLPLTAVGKPDKAALLRIHSSIAA